MAINTDAERAALYREFCEWCNTVPYLDLDPRLHTHGGRIEDGGYISNIATAKAFAAWQAARRATAAPQPQADAETLAQAYERGRRHGFRRHGFHNRVAAYMEAKEQFTIADALDADAFRLAVRLRLKTAFYDNAPPELHLPRQCAVAIKDGKFFATPYQGDDCAAMRAAIYAAAKGE